MTKMDSPRIEFSDETITSLKVEVQSSMKLDAKERDELREVLRLSIGDHVSKFSEEDLDDFGMTMLEVTAIVLKAMHSQKIPHEGNK